MTPYYSLFGLMKLNICSYQLQVIEAFCVELPSYTLCRSSFLSCTAKNKRTHMEASVVVHPWFGHRSFKYENKIDPPVFLIHRLHIYIVFIEEVYLVLCEAG